MTMPARIFQYLLLGTSALTLPSGTLNAQELPTGGQVAAGAAAITQTSPNALNINQSSNNAIINWQGFSVGQGNRVDIAQPNASSTLLNRVTGNTPSTIAGSVNANGQVYLINPNGIMITPTGQVAATGFVGSTLGLSDTDFMEGKRAFSGNGASATVTNHGTITTVGRGGYAALIGGAVENTGLIAVPAGKIGLGSGEQVTLDFSGDGFMQVAVPTKAKGKGALVKQSGKLSANGGVVVLSAAAAKQAARQAVNMSGIVEARSVSSRGGVISLSGGDGRVAVSGKLNASGKKGGRVTMTGRQIALKNARIDASGTTGGGTVRIGGDREGKGTLQRAQNVTIDSASTITADAVRHGNGGNVVVWSDGNTRFAGTISAIGGALGGNGGEVEVSGKAFLTYTGATTLTAANGQFGNLLLDPYNVTISSAADSGTPGSTLSSVINVATLQNQLALANVTVSTGRQVDRGREAGIITVANALTWSSGTTLTLNAVSSIIINAPVTIGGGGGLALNYNTASFENLAFGAYGKIRYPDAGGSLSVNGNAYTLLYTMNDLAGINAANLAGNYALANDLDASGTVSASAMIGTSATPFSGTFNGLGNSIANLTIRTENTDAAGFFGKIATAGVVRNLHMRNVSVDRATGYAGDYLGGIAGYNLGTIADSSSSGTVGSTVIAVAYTGGLTGWNAGRIIRSSSSSAVSGSNYSGGLTGLNDSSGSIIQSFATGAVNGSTYSGGLAGFNRGSIQQAYAMGAVSASDSVGGLVGSNYYGGISQSFATGAVSATTANHGGLVGTVSYGQIADSFWDIQTSGTTIGIGSVDANSTTSVTGVTTAALQGALPAGADTTIWGTGAGLYPYLKSFFPNGAQALSGIATLDGATLASTGSGAHTVSITAANRLLGTATTGANGYYYIMTAAGSLSPDSGYTAYSTSAKSALFQHTASGETGNLNFSTDTLTINSTDTHWSTIASALGNTLSPEQGVHDFIDGLALTMALSGSLTIDEALQRTGSISFTSSGNIHISTTGSVASAGAIVLAASGAFINEKGADAVTTTAGRWLVYAATAEGNVFGDLDSGNTAVWNTAAGAAVSATGNRYVFAQRPTLTVSAINGTKIYGETAHTDTLFTLTGLSTGSDNAFQADTLANVVSGAFSITSAGLANTANAGSYNVLLGLGTALSDSYALSVNAATATLTVTPRALSVVAHARTRLYGEANPALTYTATGLVNGDLLSGALATDADSRSGVGGYAITQGTLNNGNYAIFFSGNQLGITPRALTVTAHAQSRAYGADNPELTYSIAGLILDDAVSGTLATTANAQSAAGRYAITQGTLSASENYNLSFTGAELQVTSPLQVTPPPVTLAISTITATNTFAPISYAQAGTVNRAEPLFTMVTTTAAATSTAGAISESSDTSDSSEKEEKEECNQSGECTAPQP